MQDFQQFVAAVRRYTAPRYLKLYAITLLAAALLATLADRVVFPLWPVAPEVRGKIAQELGRAWPAYRRRGAPPAFRPTRRNRRRGA